jgi:4-hydroxybutyrate CoA-transferase
MNNWEEIYKQKLMLPDEAVKIIGDGDKVMVPLSNGEPPALISALARRVINGEISDITYLDGLNINCPDMCSPDVINKIKYESVYVTPINRQIINSGNGEANSVRFHDVPRILSERKFNVLMYTVSPMDKHGFFSTGINPDYAHKVGKNKYPHKILVEVNEKMPRTYGNNHFHVSEVDAIVENTRPLGCIPNAPTSKEDEIIGQFIAEQIPDGACLQLGIGGIPNAVGKFLNNKKDLSVHTEMICDSLRELYLQGVITSKEKTYMPGKWMATFVLGTQELYDFVDENPMIELWGAEWITTPSIAALNDNLMSINTTLEVDLSGQCASESMAWRQFTCVGGQADFVEAAWLSKGGKSFIATYSTFTDKEGQLQSKIVPVLNNFITVSRLDTQYIVTEYGIAYLKGKSISTRTKELINIAHPDFRDQLTFEAKKLHFIV